MAEFSALFCLYGMEMERASGASRLWPVESLAEMVYFRNEIAKLPSLR